MSAIIFFFNDTATTEIYTLSLHDALPISEAVDRESLGISYESCFIPGPAKRSSNRGSNRCRCGFFEEFSRSEEHTSELQSLTNLVCRLLLEKKKELVHDAILNSQYVS